MPWSGGVKLRATHGERIRADVADDVVERAPNGVHGHETTAARSPTSGARRSEEDHPATTEHAGEMAHAGVVADPDGCHADHGGGRDEVQSLDDRNVGATPHGRLTALCGSEQHGGLATGGAERRDDEREA